MKEEAASNNPNTSHIFLSAENPEKSKNSAIADSFSNYLTFNFWPIWRIEVSLIWFSLQSASTDVPCLRAME